MSEPLVPGQTILNRYRLKKLLGRGGFGVVWLADDEDLRMEVALKFLSDLIASNPEAVEDLKRETRFSLRLTHPHIVRIYGFFQDESMAGLSMEHVQGGTLLHLRASRGERCFGVTELSPWLSQLCDALDYAHQKVHIVHRDLKPANLMLDQNGDLKVADFGISRSISDSRTRLTNDRDTSGTLAYMSPQQMLGDSASASDDIYSLGATIYDLLSGKPPFHTGDIVHQVLHIAPPPIAKRRRDLDVEAEPVPESWESVIAACLDKESENRPASAGEVAEMLGLRGASTRTYTSTGTRGAASDPAMETRVFNPGSSEMSAAETMPMEGGPGTVVSPSGGVTGAPSRPVGRPSTGTSRGASSGGGTAMAGAAGGALAGGGTAGRTTGSAAEDDAATVIVPETVVVSARGATRGGVTASGYPTGGSTGPAPRSKLPLLIGGGVLLVLVVGGGIVLATRKDSDGSKTTAVVVPDETVRPPSDGSDSGTNPGTGSTGSETSASDGDDDDGLLPARGSETAVAGSSTTQSGTGEEGDAGEVPRLRRSVRRALAREDWEGAVQDAREILAIVPDDREATGWIRTATERLNQSEKEAARVTALKTSIARAHQARDWTRMRVDLDELERLAPRDRDIADWRNKLAAGTATAATPTPPPVEKPPPAEPVKETPPAPAPPKTEDDADLIRKTIQSYESAMEALDVDRYANLRVSLSADDRRRMTESFRDLKSQTVDIEVQNIDVNGSAAAARLRERRTVTPKVGSSQNLSRDVTMHLAKEGGRWLIVSLEYRK